MIAKFIKFDQVVEMELSEIPRVGDYVNVGSKSKNLRLFGIVSRIEWQLGDYEGFKVRAVEVHIQGGPITPLE